MSKTSKKNPGGEILSVPLAKIIPNPQNPRTDLDEGKLQDLAASLRQMGQLQPGVARPHPEKAGCFQLLAGHRRLQGLRAAGLPQMWLMVRELDDREALEVMVSENLHREDLTPLEEAAGVKTLLDIGKDLKAIANDLGKSVGWVSRRAKLADLHPKLRALILSSDCPLSAAPVEALEMLAVMPAAVQESWTTGDVWVPWQRGTVTANDIRTWISEQTMELRNAGWDLADPLLVPKAGACATCTKRSGCHLDLFDDFAAVGKHDTCLDADCWKAKRAAHDARRLGEVLAKHPQALKVSTEYQGPADAKKTGALQPGDFRPAKKSEPGAVKAVNISSDDLGRTMWVIPSAEAVKRQEEAAAPKKGRTVADKRMELDCLRIAHAMEQLGGKLVEWNGAEMEPLVLLRLVALFGTERREDSTTGFHLLAHTHKDVDVTAIVDSWTARAWEQVAPVLARRLRVGKVTKIPRAQEVEAEWFASLIGADWRELLRAADEALPEPKSWKEQERAELAEAAPKPAGGDPLPEGYENMSPEEKAAALNKAFNDDMEANPLTSSAKGKGRGKTYYRPGAAAEEGKAAGKPKDDFAGGWDPAEYAAMEASGIGMKAWKGLAKGDREKLIEEHRAGRV